MGAGRGLATEPLERVAWVVEASTAPGRQVKRASGPCMSLRVFKDPLGGLDADSRGACVGWESDLGL